MVDIQDSFGIEPMANCGLFALSTCNSGYVPVSVDINRYQFLTYTLIKTTLRKCIQRGHHRELGDS